MARVRGRLGEFWWHSLLLFCAMRTADLLNAFIGVWFVPKYISPDELGAVMPLVNFANFLAFPAAVFANVFRNELSRLAVERDFGRMKTLMRGVFVAAGVFLVLALGASRLAMPLFLERIRVAEGSLALVILAASFLSAVHPVFSNALQALKKFNESALVSIFGAPVRLVAMLVAMPFRALSGYFVGQAATPGFNIACSVFFLRKELAVPAKPYWTREIIGRFARLAAIFAAAALSSGMCALVESTVLRQRLSALDSAGYYMATRFSDIAGFMTMTLAFTIFPYAADLSAQGKSAGRLVFKASLAVAAFSALVALPFFAFGDTLLRVLPHGDKYAAYAWAIPWLIGINVLGSVATLFTTAEISANRFGYLKWMIPLELAYPLALLLVTGYGYFTGFIPAQWTDFLAAHNVRELPALLIWSSCFNIVKAAACIATLCLRKTR